MAQDLIDKIRAQAQARGLDPETAVRIAQAESSLDPLAKAKTSSAEGLFQVIDKTWKEFGGKPGQKKNADENIRVGLDILASNTKSLKSALGRDPSPSELYAAHFLGAQGARSLLTASPDTPVSELLSARAIKANPSMLKDKNAGQLLAVLEAKMGAPAATAQGPARAAPVQAPMPARAAGSPQRAALTGDLGAGYQAALALSFLGDEEDEGTPLSREEWQAKQDEVTAADMLAGHKARNALSEINWDESSLLARMQPPRQMADGGAVSSQDEVKFQQGTDALVGRAPYRSPEAQQAYLEAMNPGVILNERPLVQGTYGYVRGSAPDVLNITTEQSPAQAEQTRLHEMEHSLDFRGGDILGRPNVKRTDQTYRAYYLLNKDWAPIREFVNNVANNREQLEKFFGVPMTAGYLKMSTDELNKAKAERGRDALLPYFDEQLASLSALEQTTGKSLTRDPQMRKLFPNTQMMAVYDALTGLRQTRLDARDLPPHTPLPSYTYETNPVLRFIREKTTGKNEYGIPIKRADGGAVSPTDEVDPSAGTTGSARMLADMVNATRAQHPEYLQTEQYLKERDAVPSMRLGYFPPTVNAAFQSTRLPFGSGEVKISDEIPAYFYKNNWGPSLVAHEMAHAADRQMEQQAIEQSRMNGGRGTQFSEAYEKLVGSGGKKRTELARRLNPEWANENRRYRSSPEEIVAHGVGAFSGVNNQERAPLHVDATAAQEYQILLDLARRNVGKKLEGIERIPAFLRKIVGYKEGGEVAPPTPEEIEAAMRPVGIEFAQKSGLRRKNSTQPGQIEAAVLQGISETPYNVVGAFADLPTLVMRPFGYTNPTPFMGSEWLKQQATRLGVRPEPPTQPTARAFYEMGQLGSALVNPTAPVRGAVAAAKTGTKAAKELMQDFQAYNQQLSAPGASYAIKPKGGEFTMERPTGFAADRTRSILNGTADLDAPYQPPARVDAVQNYLQGDILGGRKPTDPLDFWVTEKLGRYMRRDMASPDDQFVKAAEQGRTLHFLPDRKAVPNLDAESDFLRYVRQSEGFNPKGEATTPYGRAVESQVDMAVEPVQLQDFADSLQRLREPLRAQVETTPEARVYDLMKDEVSDRLKFPQMVDTMASIRNSNGVFRAYGQNMPIPKEFQFSDEALKGLSPAQASERVAAYNKWTEGAREKAASQAITKNPRIETVKMGEGNTWVRVPDLDENPELLDLVKDVGCAGNWCTDKASYAVQYGSGENRLHILMDKRSQPKVQLTLTERNPNPDEFLNSMDDAQFAEFKTNHPNAALYGDVAATPEYQEWLQLNPPGYRISELKGFNNELNLKDSPVLPAIQNYVKQLSREGNLQGVANLDGIGMMSVDGLDVYGASIGRYDPKGPVFFRDALADVRARIIERNQGSSYMVKEDAPRLLQEAVDDVFGPVKEAHGGLVERRTDDGRKYL